MTVQRKKKAVKRTTALSVSDSFDATLQYGLVERLADHDLVNNTETQSLLANRGSLQVAACPDYGTTLVPGSARWSCLTQFKRIVPRSESPGRQRKQTRQLKNT